MGIVCRVQGRLHRRIQTRRLLRTMDVKLTKQQLTNLAPQIFEVFG